MPIDYDAIAKQNGAIPAPVDYNAIAKQHGATASAPSGVLDQIVSSLKEAASGAAEDANPWKIAQGINALVQGAFYHPIDTAKAIVQGNDKAREEGMKALHRGDYTSAAAHFFNWAVPAGSAVEPASEEIDQGRTAHALGRSLGVGVQLAVLDSPYVRGPVKAGVAAIKRAPGAVRETLGGMLRNPNPVEAAAAEFGRANDIPVSAGVASGNKYVQGVQALADHTPIGSVVAQRAKAAEGAAFTRVAGELADEVHPNAVAPAQAGRDVTASIEDTITGHHAEADKQYGRLREIEADPANVRNVQVGTKKVPALDARGQTIPDKFVDEPVMEDVALPVDLRPVKAQLKPVYDQIMRQLPITQQRASAGIKAIENILHGPDHAPATVADMDLGTIKAAAQGADLPELRTLSQGLAARAVKELHDAVTDAVKRAERTGPASAPAAAAEAAPADAAKLTASGSDEMGDWTVSQPAIAPARTAETTIPVPGEATKYNARYEVRELADVQPSHNGQTFSPNTKYEYRNDRNYNNPANQRKVVDWSTPAEFDAGYHVSDNPDAVNGPPIVDRNGNVLGGNGRSMIMQRVYASNPKGAAAYRQLLTDRAAQFGIDPQQLAGMKEPVLVRVLDDAHLDSPEAARKAVTDFNKVGTASLTPAERAVADAQRVSPATLEHISGRLQELGPDATLAQATEGRAGVDVLHKLIEDGVISKQEAAAYATGDALTAAGKQRISQLMLGRFFRDAEQLDAIAPAIKNKLERIAGPAAKLEAQGDYSLTPHIRDAVELIEKARTSGLKLEDYLEQGGLLTKQQYSGEAQAIAHGLTHANPTDIARVLNDYAEHAQYASSYEGPGLFGELPEPKSPREAFNHAFGTDLQETAAAPIETPIAPKPSAGFDESFKPTPAPVVKTAPPLGARVGKEAGTEALDALTAGRRATAAKYDAARVLKSLPKSGEEGRQVFDQAIWSKDAGIEHLREVKRLAPAEIPKIGRAYLDDLFSKATAEGGFKNGASLQAKWQQLGTETKELLFPNPMMRKDLDHFFLLAKRAGESPNPSGSALVGSIAALGYAFTNPLTGVPMIIGGGALSKLLHSPRGIEALSRGLTVAKSQKAAATIAANRILQVAGSAAVPLSKVVPFPQASAPAPNATAASQ